MEYLRLILFIFLIIGESFFLIRVCKFPSHLAPLSVMLFDTLILYVFAYAGLMRVGLYVVLYISIVLSIIAIFVTIRFNHYKITFLPIIAFLLTLVAIFIFTRGTLFYVWDEFSHWGLIFRFFMIDHVLPKDLNNVIVSYPPFSPLWQYFVAQIIGFKEENAYFAHTLIQITAIIALFPLNSWADWKKYGLGLLAAFLSVTALDFPFHSLYVDLLMGLLLAAGFAQSNIDGTYTFANFFTSVLCAIALVLTKPTGIVFALVVVLVNITSCISSFFPNGQHKIRFSKSLSISMIFMLILPLVAWYSWSQLTKNFDLSRVNFQVEGEQISSPDIYPWVPSDYLLALKRNEINIRVNSGVFMLPVEKTIGVTDILHSFSINAPYRTKLIAENYIKAFSDATMGLTKITLKWVLFAIFFLVTINQLILKSNGKKTQSMNLWINALLFLGFIGYAAALYLSYIFVFYPSEAIGVPSLPRYLGSYLLAWWLFNISITYRISVSPIRKRSFSYGQWILGALVGCLFVSTPTQQIIHLPESPIADRFEVNKIYKEISQVNFQPGDKVYEVYGVMPSFQGFRHYVMRYFLTPIPSNNEGWALGKHNEDDVFTVDLTPDQWFNVLHTQGYTYVLVTESSEAFWNQYGSLFDQYSPDFTSPQIFKVTADKLIYIPLDPTNQGIDLLNY